MNATSTQSTSEQPSYAANPAVARFSLTVEQVDGFEFRVRFDKDQYEDLILDEPAPLGRDRAPNAARILAADFCVVTQSVRQGLDVRVHVDWPSGQAPSLEGLDTPEE